MQIIYLQRWQNLVIEATVNILYNSIKPEVYHFLVLLVVVFTYGACYGTSNDRKYQAA